MDTIGSICFVNPLESTVPVKCSARPRPYGGRYPGNFRRHVEQNEKHGNPVMENSLERTNLYGSQGPVVFWWITPHELTYEKRSGEQHIQLQSVSKSRVKLKEKWMFPKIKWVPQNGWFI